MLAGIEFHRWKSPDFRRDLVIYWFTYGYATLLFGRGTLSGRIQKLADALARIVEPDGDA